MPVTEIVFTGGECLRVEGDPKTVESALISAARGSIMELAWLREASTDRDVAVNPEHVLMLRAPETASEREPPAGSQSAG